MDLLNRIKTSTVCHISLAFTFFVSGIIINVLQFILYLSVRPLAIHQFRKINYYLNYSSWSQITTIAEWFYSTELKVYMTPEDYRYVTRSNEHALVIMNHSYDIEWLLSWIGSERVAVLGNTRVYAKKMLKYVPIIGWNWFLSESIFLERDWAKDSNILTKSLDVLSSYKDRIWILMFCEGTRFTKEKHEASLKFAEQKGLPLLKHHLTPRTKGFVLSVKNLKGKFSAIYDVTVGFRDTVVEPTFQSVINGQKICGDLYLRRIPLEDVPTESEEECCKFLHNLYVEKDEVFDEYLRTGKFPSPSRRLDRRIQSLANLIFWNLLILFPTVCYLYHLATTGSIIVISIITIGIGLIYVGIQRMMAVTSISKASTYGLASDKLK